ncbi:MAG TPA: GAF domain-containing protein, partial [Burkholderiaceae bacterium]|nr:GAF domain-containing protein [Burkholderiaceae bacterium]
EAGLLAAITPWLEEARTTRAVTLRHGPEGAEAVDQRSCLVAPLVAQRELLGYLYCDIDGAFGRLRDADRDLLAMLAAQAAVALANQRFAAGLELKVAERTRELSGALEQQTATADILRVISESPADVQPVFDAIADRAMTLCGATIGGVARFDGEWVYLVAMRGVSPDAEAALKSAFPLPPGSGATMARAILEAVPVQNPDILSDPNYKLRDVSLQGGYRANLAVPMLHNGKAIGAIAICREQTGEFPQSQIDLLSTFADQAVIAIENVRLFNETREALERQTATAEVLRVLGSSMTDTQPVFDAIVGNCGRLFGDSRVVLWLIDGERLRARASNGGLPGETIPLVHQSPIGACVVDVRTVHLKDLEPAAERYPLVRNFGLKSGFRTGVYAPLVRAGVAIGGLAVLRREPNSFTDKDVALLGTFTDQAVIAIQNARQFHETQEALERQTATANVLKAISRTTFDLAAVLEVLIGTAARLCGASLGVIFRVEGDLCLASGLFGATPALIEHLAAHPPRLSLRDGITAEAAATGHPVQVEDAATDARYGRPDVQRVGGYRTLLAIPILREAEAIGVLTLGRAEARAFDAKEIELVTSFADQAAIAMENVRLFNETQESLQQQKASAEVLQVISSSVADTQPVFDKILDSCKHLFGGDELDVLLVDEHGQLQIAAYVGKAFDTIAATFPAPVDKTPAGIAIRERRVVHWPDVLGDAPDVPHVLRRMGREVGYQSLAFAPMVWEGRGIGAIGVARSRGAFAEKELAMLQTFADQAVIAIQNARLFNETKEALGRQTATAEVLKVISESPTDVMPVFDAIAERVRVLCNAVLGFTTRFDGEQLHLVGYHGVSATVEAAMRAAFPVKPDSATLNGRCFLAGKPVQIVDMHAEPGYRLGHIAQAGSYRSALAVPIVLGTQTIGVIGVGREEAGAFPEKMVVLLQTFARQAVIAIQNARMFNETQQALERQTATADILRVISSSVTDTTPVFQAIVRSCRRLFAGKAVSLVMPRGEMIESVAYASDNPADDADNILKPWPLDMGSGAGSCILQSRLIAVSDAAQGAKEFPRMPQLAIALGYKSCLFVPLLRDGRAIGCLAILRAVTGAFDGQELALAQTFGDQAVIAIENARLFNETQEALERQTATSEILQVISGSPTDVQPVLQAVAERGAKICAAQFVDIILRQGESISGVAVFGNIGGPTEPIPLDRSTVMGRAIVERRPVHVADLQQAQDDYPRGSELARRHGHHTTLAVPLLREGRALGAILVRRTEVLPFDDKHIALLRTFADQAAIAIENTRLFNETQEALEQQTATAEILRVISESPDDLQPVFHAIVGAASRLFSGAMAFLLMREGDAYRAMSVARPGQPLTGPSPDLVPLDVQANFPSRVILGKAMLHLPDWHAVELPPHEQRVLAGEGLRASLLLPIVQGDECIGALGIARKQPGEFSAKEIALMRAFVDQAVIAIHNVRLFNETKEALDQQRASSEVLTAISNSIADTRPVFDVILQSSQHLFASETVGMTLVRDDGLLDIGAYSVPGEEALRRVFPQPLTRDTASGQAILGRRLLVYEDVDAGDMPRASVEGAHAMGLRSLAFAPMVFGGRGIGTLWIGRTVTGPFGASQLALLATFADQAVIAIQNARLFRETNEALERQTGTAEILKVIASSPSNVQPVFEAIAQSSNRLIGGFSTAVFRIFDDTLHLVAFTPTNPAADEALQASFPVPIARFPLAAPLLEGAIVRITDTEDAAQAPEMMRNLARQRGYRSMLFCPLLREGKPIGMISVTRRDPGPFAPHLVELLQTFGDQAVIAIENVRLFNETKEALELQTTSAEVLRVVGESMADAQPVFDSVCASLQRLLPGTELAIGARGSDGRLHWRAGSGAHAEGLRALFPRPAPGGLITGTPSYWPDLAHGPDVPESLREAVRTLGENASMLSAAMISGGEVAGTLATSGPSAPPGRVLIIDDNTELVGALQAVLVSPQPTEGGGSHLRVMSAAFGEEGLALARTQGFDVAIVDVKLPDMSGVDLIRPLRALVPFGEVVLITGFATMDDAMGALRSGAFAFIPKS